MGKFKALFAILLSAVLIAGAFYWLRRYKHEIPEPVPEFNTQGRLQVYALDVGQGESMLIVTPGGKTVLIDAGNPQSGDTVVAALRKHKVSGIDLAVATHPHADHIGGMRSVIESFSIRNFLDSGRDFSSAEYERLLKAIKSKRISFINAKSGMTFDLDSGIKLEAFFPKGDNQWITRVRSGGSLENANSVVLRLTYGSFSMLFTCDAEFETEAAMLKSGFPLNAQVIKIGHHGSRYATSGKFLDAVGPQMAIISCGMDNRYGHPSQSTLDRLKKSNIQIYRTDLNREISIFSDGRNYQVRQERGAETAAMWIGRIESVEFSAAMAKKSTRTVVEVD